MTDVVDKWLVAMAANEGTNSQTHGKDYKQRRVFDVVLDVDQKLLTELSCPICLEPMEQAMVALMD